MTVGLYWPFYRAILYFKTEGVLMAKDIPITSGFARGGKVEQRRPNA